MKFVLLLVLIFITNAFAQTNQSLTAAEVQKMIDDKLSASSASSKSWYNNIAIKGYAQFRYNRLGETNRDYVCTSCDRSIGDKQGFFMRRARLVFYGQVSDRVFIYIQPDYASTATDQNYLQIRDAYFDYNLTQDGDFRIRTGISKVPYGFENLQSSGARAPLDRDDALNTGAPNERDTGVYFMYASTEIRKRFKELQALKGTGDYGIFAIGAYNGQSLNKPEQNNDLHRAARLTYPWKLQNGQFIEASIQAYEGKFIVGGNDHYDARQAASFIVYPQPIGFQVEFTVGRGPEYDPTSNRVERKNLEGGYAMLNYQLQTTGHRFFPYLRYQEYEGGRKLENAATSEITEWEFGTEWQPNSAFELTAAYAIGDRVTQSTATNRFDESGSLIRLQAQFNY